MSDDRGSQKRIATSVNRGLAWIGIASSLVGILDVVAIVLILRYWVTVPEYGALTAIVWVFPLLDQATDLGLSAAVIQRDDHDDTKISTVFWINFITAIAMFAILAIVATIIASITHDILGWMLVAYGTKLLIQNAYFIPLSLMKRELRFKELSIIRIVANLGEFAAKVGFAWAGFGIWCFVLGPLARTLISAVGAQLRHPWRPKLVLRFRDAKEYVTFGLKSSGSQILFHFYVNIDQPIVRAFFGDHAAGLYKIAYETVLHPVRMISNVVVDIAFPTFARLQHSKDRLLAQLVSFTKLNIITVLLYAAVVFVAAEDVLLMFFPRAAGAETAVRVLCAVAVLRSLGYVVPPLLDGTGHPNRTFNYMLSAAVALPLSFWLGAVLLGDRLGYVSVAVAWAIGYPIAFGVLIWLAMYTLGWTARAYLRSVIGVLACLFGALFVALLGHWAMSGLQPWLRLALTAAIVVLVTGFSLAYTQGLSLRSAKRALAGDSDAVIDDPLPVDEASAGK
ncbi:MAG: oligosaccharide flippase family protein [Myxococcota bacterium]|nr:oligosaccharide flippase family protein [Myxococcota bacterium]